MSLPPPTTLQQTSNAVAGAAPGPPCSEAPADLSLSCDASSISFGSLPGSPAGPAPPTQLARGSGLPSTAGGGGMSKLAASMAAGAGGCSVWGRPSLRWQLGWLVIQYNHNRKKITFKVSKVHECLTPSRQILQGWLVIHLYYVMQYRTACSMVLLPPQHKMTP